MVQVLDYSRGYPRAAVIAAAGYGGVVRYLPREGATGVLPITRAELADMRAHNRAVVLIHQHADRQRALQGRPAGLHDASWALGEAHKLADNIVDFPDILFAVDFDTVPSQWPAITEYAAGLGEVMGRGRNDAYGEYDLLVDLARRGVVQDGWQTYAWSPGHNQDGQSRAPIARLFQRLAQTTVDGVLCDVNDVLDPTNFGQLRYREASVTWRVARSLNVLLNQLNARAPSRSIASDGSIGDAAHATRDSDHNPWYVVAGLGVVTARDFTHDPAGGLDCHWLAAQLVASGDRRIKYVIWDRRIWTPAAGWQPYTRPGSNPHTSHLHLSVVASSACDDTTAWTLTEGDNDMTPDQDAVLRKMAGTVAGLDYALSRSYVAGKGVIGDQVMRLETKADAMAAVLTTIARNPDITPDQLAAVVDDAVARHTPSAEAIAAATIPTIRDAVREVLGEDNAELADEIVDELTARLAGGGA